MTKKKKKTQTKTEKAIKIDEFFGIISKHVEIKSRIVGTYNITNDHRWYAYIENVTITSIDDSDGRMLYTHICGDAPTATGALQDLVNKVSNRKVILLSPNWVHKDYTIEIDVPQLYT